MSSNAAPAVLVLLAGCGAAGGHAPSPPVAPSACDVLAEREVARAGALVDAGALDQAAMALEEALRTCPSARRLDEKRREIEASLDAAGATLAQRVEEGWAKKEAGDADGARRAFSQAIRASLAGGASPRALPLVSAAARDVENNLSTVARLDERTLLLGATDLEEKGAVVMRYRRAGGHLAAHPLRFAARRTGADVRLAAGEGGRFAIAHPAVTVLYPQASAPAIELPGGSAHVFADRGSALVVARDGGVETFDAATGARRGALQPIAMPEARPLVAERDGPLVTRCSLLSYDTPYDAFVLDARSGRLLARSPRAQACVFDAARRRMVSLRVEPAPRGRFTVLVDVAPTDGSTPSTTSLGAHAHDAPMLYVDTTGEVQVTVKVGEDKFEELYLPARRPKPKAPRKKAKGPGQPLDPLWAIPFVHAEMHVDLAPLHALAKPPREILPNEYTPGFHTWTANGARSRDGKWVAVVDRDLGGDGVDEDLLLADAASMTVRHRVHLTPQGHDWLQVAFLDDRFVTVRQQWTTHVIDVPSGTLRAIVDVESINGSLPTLLGDDLAAVANAVVDLTGARTLHDGAAAYVPLPLSAGLRRERAEGTTRLFEENAKAAGVVLHDDGRVELPSGSAPPWLHCALGEWVVPFQACAHRLLGAPPQQPAGPRPATP